MTPQSASAAAAEAPSTASPTTETGVAFNSLDAIYQRLAKAVGSQQLTADGFNVYLAQQLESGKTPPSPTDVFTSTGWDRNATMTLANYWGAMAPYLKSNLGLSGIGNGVYCELYGAMRNGGLYGFQRRVR